MVKKFIFPALILIMLMTFVIAGTITVTLNSPVNYYNSSGLNILFNATGSSTSTIVNSSLWMNFTGTWHRNETKTVNIYQSPNYPLDTSGSNVTGKNGVRFKMGTQKMYITQATKDTGSYITKAYLLSETKGILATSSSFVGNVATFSPPYELNASTIYYIAGDKEGASYSNRRVAWNFGVANISNSHLDWIYGFDDGVNSASYIFEFENITISESINAGLPIFTKNITQSGIWNVQFCDVDGSCNFATNNRTILVPVLINNIAYNSTALLTSLEMFRLNITIDGSQTPIIYLNYNNVSYLTTLIDGEYVSNISVNTVGTIPFFYNISYGATEIISSTYYQTVSSFSNMSIINGTCPTGLTRVMNFTFADEINLTTLNNYTVKYNFKYGVSNSTGTTYYGGLTNVNQVSVCLNTSQSPTYLLGYGELEYNRDDYVSRKYYVFANTRVSNVTINTTLYSLPTIDSTSFLIEVRSPTLEPYTGKYTSLLRWYPNLNEYKVVEMGKTDEKGQIVKKVKIEDVDYRIGVYETDGTLVYLAEPIRMICLTSPCSYTINVPAESLNPYSEVGSITAEITYLNGTFTLVYNDPSQNTDVMSLRVYQISGDRNTLICESNGTAFTGILTCDVSSYSGVFKAVAVRTASPERVLVSLLIDTLTTVFTSKFGLFLQFVILLVLIFLGIVSPIVSIILAMVALVFGTLTFKTITYPIFIGIAVIGGIIIYFIRRQRNDVD